MVNFPSVVIVYIHILSVCLYECMYVCCMYVCCMYVCLYECMYVCCMYVCCMYVCMSVCMNACMYVCCMYVCCMYVCMNACMYVCCMYVCCMYACMYVYTNIHILLLGMAYNDPLFLPQQPETPRNRLKLRDPRLPLCHPAATLRRRGLERHRQVAGGRWRHCLYGFLQRGHPNSWMVFVWVL